jgi:hypothetical protein
MLHMITGTHTRHLLEVYSFLTEMKTPPLQKTAKYIQDYYTALLQDHIPLLDTNLRVLEQENQRVLNKRCEAFLSLPMEIKELICQYTLPNECHSYNPYKPSGEETVMLDDYLQERLQELRM